MNIKLTKLQILIFLLTSFIWSIFWITLSHNVVKTQFTCDFAEPANCTIVQHFSEGVIGRVFVYYFIRFPIIPITLSIIISNLMILSSKKESKKYLK